jgi:hypothetical protein
MSAGMQALRRSIARRIFHVITLLLPIPTASPTLHCPSVWSCTCCANTCWCNRCNSSF